jgi:hypothetical protein
MVNRRRGVLIVGLAVVAAVASIVLADVIFVYTGTINVQPMTTAPLVFSTGPNAGPTNTNAEPYISFTGGYGGFTVTLVITDSSAVYYYEAGELTVNTPGYIYVSSVSVTPSYTASTAPVQSMTIYIQDTSGSIACQLPVISGGLPDPPPPPSPPPPSSPATTPSSSCKLGAGTYYISIKVMPNLPVTGSSTETVTVNFGYNVISGASVPVPT